MGEIYYGEATALRRLGIPTWGLFHYKQHSHGGAMLDVGVHMLDLAIYLMNNPKPVRVSAQMATKFGQRPEIAKQLRNAWDPAKFDVEDFAVALVHFENGASLLLSTSWAVIDTSIHPASWHRGRRHDDAAGRLPQPRGRPRRPKLRCRRRWTAPRPGSRTGSVVGAGRRWSSRGR
jgi:predicted dehydrogenase